MKDSPRSSPEQSASRRPTYPAICSPTAQRLGSAVGGASATTIAAPGEGLTAPTGDSGTSTVEGTSFATALVTGGVTLLQQIYESRFGALPTVDEIKGWIQDSATPVYDPTTGITIGELNLAAAAALIPKASAASTPTTPITTASPTSTPSTPVTTTSQVTTTTTSQPSTSSTTTSATTATTTAAATSTATTSTSSSAATTSVASTASAQVYINGQPVNTGTTTASNAPASLDLSAVDALFASLGVDENSASSGSAGTTTSQLQIWNA